MKSTKRQEYTMASSSGLIVLFGFYLLFEVTLRQNRRAVAAGAAGVSGAERWREGRVRIRDVCKRNSPILF